MKHIKKIIIAIAFMLTLAGGTFAQAYTTEELRTLIAQLQAQLAAMTATEPTTVCVGFACPVTPNLTVISPNGGEVYRVGERVTITWDSSVASRNEKVRIELGYTHTDPTYAAGNYFEDWIIDKTPNTGSYTWTIPAYYATGILPSSFAVKVVVGGMTDYSDGKFTVVEGRNKNKIKVISPSSDAGYYNGESLPISWKSNAKDQYSVSLLKKSDPSFQRLSLNTGNYAPNLTWTIPNDIPRGNDYYIKVSEGLYRDKVGYSGLFSIKPGSGIEKPTRPQRYDVTVCDSVSLVLPRSAVPNDQYRCDERVGISAYTPATLRWFSEPKRNDYEGFISEDIDYLGKSLLVKGSISHVNGGDLLVMFDCNEDGKFEDAANVRVNQSYDLVKMRSFVKEPCGGRADIMFVPNSPDQTITVSSVVYTDLGSQSSVSAVLQDAYQDKVSGDFRPGTAINNRNPNDWHWQAVVNVPETKTIKYVYITSNTGGEGWATTDSKSILGKSLYPLYVMGKGFENTAYNQKIDVYNGTNYFDLYGQPETTSFAGGTIGIVFTDGTTITGKIPASKIMQSPVSSTKPLPISSNRPPVITGGTFPTIMKVNETATWKVNAYDPEGGSLSYSIVWGDEPSVSTAKAMSKPFTASQSTTFTHSYVSAGTYTPIFYVFDSEGAETKTSASVMVAASVTQ